MKPEARRHFLRRLGAGSLLAASGWSGGSRPIAAAPPSDAPLVPRAEAGTGVEVLNPRGRVPVGIIIDDSTCLVNLNRFAVPQFAQAWGDREPQYQRLPWRDWPNEIPDAFVRKFGEWAAAEGVRGKYSIVPYPACVGRLDRFLPGWTQRELANSLALVREVMLPRWDIHPEMVTHTRVIDTQTGHPYPECTPAYMENWDWTTGRSTDELADYLTYALRILEHVDLPCDGVTTPGGFGSRARPQLAQAAYASVRAVFRSEIPHYFRDVIDEGAESVSPRVQAAEGHTASDPRVVVSVLACTGDWTGGWQNVEPEGADRFITADLAAGRMVDVIARGEPAFMLAHWTGVYWNGQERGFQVFQEVVRRLKARFDRLIWMKPSEVARYWAARQLTRIEVREGGLQLHAPFACPDFTLQWSCVPTAPLRFSGFGGSPQVLREVRDERHLEAATWCRRGDGVWVCLNLPRGESRVSAGGA